MRIDWFFEAEQRCRIFLFHLWRFLHLLQSLLLDDPQRFISHRHIHHKQGTLSFCIILDGDGSLVQAHQQRGQVQSDTRTHIAILMLGRVEALKHLLLLIIWNADTRVCHLHLKISALVLQQQGNLTTIRRELKGIRQQVHHNLIHIVRIDIHLQPIHIVYKLILNIAALCIGGKHIIDALQKLHQIHRMIVEQELALFNLSHIHHLIDQSKDTLRVLLHQLIVLLTLRILVTTNHLLQRSQNQGHRRTNLMTDVHEELHTRLIQFALLAVTCHDATQSDLTPYIFIEEPTQGKEQKEIGHLCPHRRIPCRMNRDNKLAFLTHGSHCQCTHLDMIDTWSQVSKDDT